MSSLALDVGGTFVKGAWIADGGVSSAVVRRRIPAFLSTDFDEGAREIAPQELDAAVRSVLDDLGVKRIADQAIFVSGQMAGLAFVDEMGEAVSNIISWQDSRFQGVDEVRRELGSDAVRDLGDGLRVGSPVVTMANKGVPDGTYPMSLIGYVAGRLAGGRVERIHSTDAGSWGMWDTRQGRWSKPACSLVGVDGDRLPNVVSDVLPTIAGSAVFTAVGDQQASLLGAGLGPDQLSVNLATGCQVAVLADSFSDVVQTRPYFYGYLHTVTHLPAGRALTRVIESEFGSVDESAWKRASRDAHHIAAVARVVEEIAESVADAARQLGTRKRKVLFSGGLVQRFPPLRSAILERLGDVSYRVFDGDDAAIMGLATIDAKAH